MRTAGAPGGRARPRSHPGARAAPAASRTRSRCASWGANTRKTGGQWQLQFYPLDSVPALVPPRFGDGDMPHSCLPALAVRQCADLPADRPPTPAHGRRPVLERAARHAEAGMLHLRCGLLCAQDRPHRLPSAPWLGHGGAQPAALRPVLPCGLPAPALVRGFPQACACGAPRRLGLASSRAVDGAVPATSKGDLQ